MSITSITITKPISPSVLAVHSPIVFLAEAEEATSNFPDALTVNISKGGSVVATLSAYPYAESGTTRTYIFHADKVLRRFLSDIAIIDRTGIARATHSATEFEIEFTDDSVSDSAKFVAYASAAQRGMNEKVAGLTNNTIYENVYAWKNRPCFLNHYVSSDETFPLTLAIGSSSQSITQQGLYQSKAFFSTIGQQLVNISYNGTLIDSISVKVLEDCPGGINVAFYDNAIAAFKTWQFNRYHTIEGTTEDIGSVLKVATELAEPNTLPIGKRETVRYLLTADGLDNDMLEYLLPIMVSHRVYLNINGVWVLCKVEEGSIPYKRPKQNASALTLSVMLPERYNVTML